MQTPASPYHPITEQILAAAADRRQLRVRGGGSKDFYGEPLQGGVLDTRGLSGITSYEPSELVVTVQAGTPLAELEAALTEKGQCLAFEVLQVHALRCVACSLCHTGKADVVGQRCIHGHRWR